MGYTVKWKVKDTKCIVKYLDAKPDLFDAKPYIMEMEQPYLVDKKMVVPKYTTDYKTFKRLDENVRGRGCYLLSVYYIDAKYVAKYIRQDIITGEIKEIVVGEHENEIIARLLAIHKALTGKDYIDKITV